MKERRQAGRNSVVWIAVFKDADGKTHRGVVADVSERGVRLRSVETTPRVTPNAQTEVTFMADGVDETISVRGNVRWSESGAGRSLGIELEMPVPAALRKALR